MADKYMNRLSISYVIREMQIKTRKHHTPIRMSRTQSTGTIKCWRERGAAECLSIAGWNEKWYILEGNFDGYLQIFIATLFIIVKTWKHPRYPSAGEYGAVEYLDNEILFSAKIKWIVKP